MVLFIPGLRLPTFKPSTESAAAEPTKKKTKLCRPPAVELLGAGMIKQLAAHFGCTLKFECIEHCKHPNSCTHQEDNRKRLTFLGQTLHGGLTLTVQRASTLNLAETLPDSLVMSFLKLDCIDIFRSWMPPPSS